MTSSMMQVYKKDNINFSKNGDMIIQPTSAILTNAGINTIPSIELDLSYDEYKRWEYAINDSVIRCHTPWDKSSGSQGQLFRVYETEKDTESYKIYAKHIMVDLITTTAKDFNNDDVMIVATGLKTGFLAMQKLMANSGFNGYSNINNTNSVRWERKAITEALLSDDENSFVKSWGGELYCDNFDIYMNTKIGGNYNVRIAYGKNLDSITENINNDGIITRIIPVGYNGLRLTGLTPWVDSPNIYKFPNPLEKVIEFSNVKVKENSEDEEGFDTLVLAQNELIRLSNLMFTQEHIDTPIVNIQTSMVDISDTMEYKSMGYSGLEEVNLGDTVICSHYKIGIETEARCVAYTWNVITEKMIDIEIGDVTKNFFDKQNDMSNAISKILDGNTVKADKIAGIINALQTKFKAQRSIAQPQEVRAMLFEDSVIGSPSYGATTIGTLGLQIANTRTTDGKDWNWNTFITGGLVYADWLVGNLKTVLIENADASFQIDLSGTGGASFFNNGKKALEIAHNRLDFYNFAKDGDFIGSLGSSITQDHPEKPALALFNDLDSALYLAYKKDNSSSELSTYMICDKYNIVGTGEPIRFWEEIAFNRITHFYTNQNMHKTRINFYNGDNLNGYLSYAPQGGIYCSSKLSVVGDFACTGTKTRVVNTSEGKVKLNAYETTECLFADYGNDKLDENGICTIYVDSLFAETILLAEGYEVFITKYGKGDIWVEDREMSSFFVQGEPNLKFAWNIVAKQKGYENIRLDKFEEKEESV